MKRASVILAVVTPLLITSAGRASAQDVREQIKKLEMDRAAAVVIQP